MSEQLAKAAMYAMRGLIGGLRDADMLDDRVIDAMQNQIDMALNFAWVLESSAAAVPDPQEARAIRHGTWWLRECIAPTANFEPGPVNDHPRYPSEWPKLADVLRGDK